ncbi:MAG: hypothetical protein J0L58_16805 [Burkholderiales bacterium]|nr:hypothetical protein [Burkholderiales bacterium]
MRLQLSAGAVLAVAGLAAGAWVLWRASSAASGAAAAVGDAFGSVSDAVGQVGEGLYSFTFAPPPERGWLEMGQGDEVTSDPAVARWLIDRVGWWDASKWATAGALWTASGMPAGSGRRPPAGSAAGRQFASVPESFADPAPFTPIHDGRSFEQWQQDPYGSVPWLISSSRP